MKFLVASFMILKVKRWMAMNNQEKTESKMPLFRSTFFSFTDSDGYLINQDNLTCVEITKKSLMVLRTSKDLISNKKVAKELFNVKLPNPLSVTSGSNDAKCFWISPDEFWLLYNSKYKADMISQSETLPKGVSMTDNSAAYGILEFTGKSADNLLARWMSYDLSGSLIDGKAVSTTLGQAPVFVWRDNQKILMMVRHSFSHYVLGLLKDSAQRI